MFRYFQKYHDAKMMMLMTTMMLLYAIDDDYQPTCCDVPQFVSLAPNTGGIYNLHSNGIETDEDNDDYDDDCDDDEDDDEDDDDDVQDGLTRCREPSDEGDICGDTG